jgi:hypothetical protein
VFAVVDQGERGEEALDEASQIGLRGLQVAVQMVGHDAVGPDADVEDPGKVDEPSQQEGFVAGV